MIKTRVSGMIVGALLAATVIWGVLQYEQQTQKRNAPVSGTTSGCVVLPVYYMENGLLYELGKSRACITGTDFVVADIIWPPGQEVK